MLFKWNAILGGIIPDLKSDLNKYRYLDKLIYINPMLLSEKEKEKFLQLCDICPDMDIYDGGRFSSTVSTIKEYKNAEEWIKSVLQEVNPEWEDIEKVAYIDNAIGKRISYSPNFNTEVFKDLDSRALWKIIDTGYGTCEGISKIEKYMFDKIGVDSEIIESKTHAFLKLKKIKLPNVDGTIEIGDTILDPTWNLAAHRYRSYPENFCLNYEDIRQHDRSDKGDYKAHENDEELKEVIFSLDEKVVRKIYTKIGIADEKGEFPLQSLINAAKLLSKPEIPQEEKWKKALLLIQEYQPDFAVCINETVFTLSSVISDYVNLEFKQCIMHRVYNKADKDKKAVLYVSVNLPGVGKKFYFAEKETAQFVELTQKEVEEKFECYEADKIQNNGFRLWEIPEKETNERGEER